MISFLNWLTIRESSATTRRKLQAAWGLAPPVADIFGRSTPPPWQVEKLTKALNKTHKKKKKKKKRQIHEARKQPSVNKEIDLFIKKAEELAKDIWELNLLKKKQEIEKKMDKITKKYVESKPIEKKSEEENQNKKEIIEKKNKTKENKKEKNKSTKNQEKKDVQSKGIPERTRKSKPVNKSKTENI